MLGYHMLAMNTNLSKISVWVTPYLLATGVVKRSPNTGMPKQHFMYAANKEVTRSFSQESSAAGCTISSAWWRHS